MYDKDISSAFEIKEISMARENVVALTHLVSCGIFLFAFIKSS